MAALVASFQGPDECAAVVAAMLGGAVDVQSITESAVNGPEFDQPTPDPGVPTRRLIVCTTPRSGSYLLARQLIRAGIGIPHEYLNEVNADVMIRRAFEGADPRSVPPSAYHTWLERNRTTPNGVFAVKIHWDQMAENPQIIERWLQAPGTVCLFLHRRKLLSQAVSFRAALHSGVWDVGEDVSTEPRSMPLVGARRENDQLAYRLVTWNAMWRFLFEAHDVPVLDLAYEDLAADQTAALQSIAEALGVTADLPDPERFTGFGTRSGSSDRHEYVMSWAYGRRNGESGGRSLGYVRRVTAASMVDAARRGLGGLRESVRPRA